MNPLLDSVIMMPVKKENPLFALGKSLVRGSNAILSGGLTLGGVATQSPKMLQAASSIDDAAQRFAPRTTPNLLIGPDSLYAMRTQNRLPSRETWAAVPRSLADSLGELAPQLFSARALPIPKLTPGTVAPSRLAGGLEVAARDAVQQPAEDILGAQRPALIAGMQ